MLKQLAGHCELNSRDGNALRFYMTSKQRHFLNDERQRQLQQALSAWASETVSLQIELVDRELENTPMQRHKQRLKQRLDAAQQSLQSDNLLQEFMQKFDANIIPGSVASEEKEDT